MALINKLSAIGNAIREKGGTTELLTLAEMPDAITNLPSGGGGDIEVEPIVLTGDCKYSCSGAMSSTYIRLFGDTVSTSDITNGSYMFNDYRNDTIPFDINFKLSSSTSDFSYMFNQAKIERAPRIINVKPNTITNFFYDCRYLREIPDDFCDTWDWSYLNSYNYGNCSNLFSNCYSLRKIPTALLKNVYSGTSSSYYVIYYRCFNSCFTLDEINGLVVVPQVFSSNVFQGTFDLTSRLKKLVFMTNEDGTAKSADWKNQVINLSMTGYYDTSLNNIGNFINYNSGITADKYVYDDATYQALKNDADWFSTDVNYSRYNRISAVETINSLPDCSASGGVNTIKFTGEAGALTDGGAINTLTETEIAVATAKGWTVSFV